ncbi:helix-turn-helix domain-containing protein [Bradyrhizobium japonicum]|uniref:helix-turn-helix domain-containing protein n=1 Tax=Bradyrhizobium japonicum TaxID=375 RepID=UPI001BA8E92B|nr:helix-turn-helix domain-containing protein [Bradyrhizobium japonicum]MBR0746543.1 helix-turn-helix domain-containing protein [Bradyrhizobium japonicum]
MGSDPLGSAMLPQKYDTTLALKAIGLSDQLNKTEKRVAVALLDHYNRKTSRCDPSQQTLAALLYVDRKTVNRAIKKIVRLGYFKSLRHSGNRHCNSYQPCWHRFRTDEEKWKFDRRRHAARFWSQEVSPSEGHHRPNRSGEFTSQTFPKNIFPPTSTHVDGDVFGDSILGSPAPSGPPNGLGIFAARIEKRLGNARFRSWFHSARLVEVRREEVTLSVETKFVAVRIVEQFEPQVLECFRPEYPDLVRLLVVVRDPA